jgi:HEPN domain-containing protein
MRQAEADLRHAVNARGAPGRPRRPGRGRKRLDKHYIPTRYPNGFDTGAPTDYYTDEEAERAIAEGGRILDFCRDSVG